MSRLNPFMQATQPSFSSDGSEIYFWGVRGGDWGIWSMSAGGGGLTQWIAFDDPSLTAYRTFNARSLTVGNDHFYLTISEYESDIWVMDLEW